MYSQFRVVFKNNKGEFIKGMWIPFNNLIHKGTVEDFVNYADDINQTELSTKEWFLEFI